MDKGSGSGIFPDPGPGDPTRPDSTGSGFARLHKTIPYIKNKCIHLRSFVKYKSMTKISLFYCTLCSKKLSFKSIEIVEYS